MSDEFPSIVVRSEAQGLAAIKLPRVVKNFKASLRFKPKSKTAIILPCASIKPFSASVTHSGGYDVALGGSKADRWIASEPLGIVPQAWENRAPNNDYDFPPKYLRGSARAALIERFSEFFRLVAPKYKKIVIATPGHHERLIRAALAISPASNVKWAGQRACLDSGACPPGHIRATTKAYKGFLEKTMRRNPGRVLLPARKNPVLMVGNPGGYHGASRARELDPQDALARMRAERMAVRSGVSEVPPNLEWLRIFATTYKEMAQDHIDIIMGMPGQFGTYQVNQATVLNRLLDDLLGADLKTSDGRELFMSRARGLAGYSQGAWFRSGLEMLVTGQGAYPGVSNNFYVVACGYWWYYLVTLNNAVSVGSPTQFSQYARGNQRILLDLIESTKNQQIRNSFSNAGLVWEEARLPYQTTAEKRGRFNTASEILQTFPDEDEVTQTILDIFYLGLRTAFYIGLEDGSKPSIREAQAYRRKKVNQPGYQRGLFQNPGSDGSAPLRFAGLAGLLPRSGRALDFGCGSGRDTGLLNHAGLTVTSYDPKTRPTRPRGKFKYAQAVYVFNTIKSPKKRRAALKDFKKHLAKGGRWLIAVRGTKEIQGQAKRYKWKKSGDGYGSKTSSAWQRGYTPEQLAKFLKLEGIRAAQIWKKHGSVIAVSHALKKNPSLDQLPPLPKGYPAEDRDQMPFDWSNEGYQPPPKNWTPRKNPGPGLHPDAVPISSLPASIRNSQNFKAQMKAMVARYGKATHVIPAQLPPGSPKVVAGIGELGRYHYQAADKAGEPISTWYHDPGDFGEGSNGAPQILAWDAVSGFPVIAFPSDSGMKWTYRGIQG